MRAFSDAVYPAVLLAMVAVLVAGAVAYVAATRIGPTAGAAAQNTARFARLLIVATWVARGATGIEIVAIGALLGAGVTHPPMIMLVGYLVAAVAVLGLLGISRLGAPPAPGEAHDPDRPALSPRQMVQADGAAAMIVGAALAVVAWRLNTILLAG
ncbi:MAG TPA: hypothetical protein VF362_03715 [Demequinaceae bacterium]